jgi:hypothetical protein
MGEDDTTAESPARVMSQVLGNALRDQLHRQERLRHAQAFLTSPLFVDLAAAPVAVADDLAALEEHHHDLVYRIGVLRSVLALMEEERAHLERLMARETVDLAEGLGLAPGPMPD